MNKLPRDVMQFLKMVAGEELCAQLDAKDLVAKYSEQDHIPDAGEVVAKCKYLHFSNVSCGDGCRNFADATKKVEEAFDPTRASATYIPSCQPQPVDLSKELRDILDSWVCSSWQEQKESFAKAILRQAREECEKILYEQTNKIYEQLLILELNKQERES